MNSDFKSRYKKLTLSATYDADSFFYCLWGDDITLLKYGAYDSFEQVRQEYSDARLIVSSSGLPFTHVSSKDYNKDHNEIYLHNISRLNPSNSWTLSSNKIGVYDLVTVYGFKQKTLEKYSIQNSSEDVVHGSSAIIWGCLQYPTKQPAVFLNIGEKYFSITVVNNESLILHNQYAFTASEDILYYVCLVYDQLNMDRSLHNLWLSGNITEDSALYKLIYTYVQHVHFVELDFQLESEIDRPKHIFLDHFSLISCV